MNNLIKRIFFPGTDFSSRYSHVGYSYLSIPCHWQPIVQKAIADIEKLMWSTWMPYWLKRLIHYLATGNSVVRVKYWWAYNLRTKLTRGSMIQDIKEKYATLRIYGYFSDEMNDIIKIAEQECLKTCQDCGSNDDVQIQDTGWVYNYCKDCRVKYKKK